MSSGRCGSRLLVDEAGHFSGIRESSCLLFRVDLAPIYDHIEDAVAAGHQIRLDREGRAQLIRQTGGVGFVVSHRTIVDINLHRLFPQ